MEVYKVTLSTGKVVLLREQKIADTETAATVAGKGVGDNQALLSVRLQKEMLKLLLVEVDGKKVSMSERELLDKLFSPHEYLEIQRAVSKICAPDTLGNELVMDFVTIGAQSPGQSATPQSL